MPELPEWVRAVGEHPAVRKVETTRNMDGDRVLYATALLVPEYTDTARLGSLLRDYSLSIGGASCTPEGLSARLSPTEDGVEVLVNPRDPSVPLETFDCPVCGEESLVHLGECDPSNHPEETGGSSA